MNEKPWEDEYVLRKLYCEQDLTMEEVGDVLGCSRHPIHKNLKKFGISRQDPVHHRINNNGYEVWEVAVDDSYTTVPVHRLLAVSEFGMRAVDGNHIHHKNGVKWDNRPSNIEPREPSNHLRMHNSKYSLLDSLRLLEFYRNGDCTLKTASDEVGMKKSAATSKAARARNGGVEI